MANPNPSPATRFSAEKPGSRRAKQKGARDRMTAAFLEALADDFEQHGAKTVARVREEDPAAYLRVYATMAPKEIEITLPLDDMSDAELTAAIQALTEVMRGQVAPAGDEADAKPTMN